MALAISAVLAAIFVLNILLGALADAQFMGDVPEMIVLLIASIAFVVAILQREGAAKAENGSES